MIAVRRSWGGNQWKAYLQQRYNSLCRYGMLKYRESVELGVETKIINCFIDGKLPATAGWHTNSYRQC